MGIKYKLSQNATYDVVLVKASTPYAEFQNASLDWTSYFNTVNVIETDGDHLSMIRTPYVETWIHKLHRNES